MNRRSEQLLQRIEKAGIRASIKQGHRLTEEEMRKIKVQVLPAPVRVLFGFLGLLSAGLSWVCYDQGLSSEGLIAALVALGCLLFAIFGVKRTLAKVLDAMDVLDSVEIVSRAMKGIGKAVEYVLD